MKKIITIVLAVFCISAANAQLEKGTTFLSGSFNVSGYSKPQGNWHVSNLNIGISPKFGGFVSKHVLLGGELNLGFDHNLNKDNYSSPSTIYYDYLDNTFDLGAGFFVRYYAQLTTHFYFTLNSDISYTYSIGKSLETTNDPYSSGSYPRTTNDYTGTIGVAISPGFTYLVTPRIGLGMSFGSLYFNHAGIRSVYKTSTTKTSDNEYGLDLKMASLNFGVSFYFGGGKEKK